MDDSGKAGTPFEMINPRLQGLADYPFARYRALIDRLEPPPGLAPIALTLGEPQHAAPAMVAEVLAANAADWNRYPPLNGTPEFRAACVDWLTRRYGLPSGTVDPDACILPVSGTREALFLAPLLAVDGRPAAGPPPAVILPNPFYAPYEGGAVMAGAEPVFADCTAETGFLPDLDALEADGALMARTALMYLCTPSNPQGAVADRAYLTRAIALARRHGWVLVVDECYGEIYDAEPPPGVLEVAAALDGGALDNLLVFHSLSKRSNAAGLRAGFVAGDPTLIAAFDRLRRYAGAGMPRPVMAAAAALWADDAHVAENRARYRAKFDAAEAALAGRMAMRRPPAGFFLWLDVSALAPHAPDPGEAVARRLWAEAAVRALPGAYLTHAGADGVNRGAAYLRLALVHEPEVIAEALARLADLAGSDGVESDGAAAGGAPAGAARVMEDGR
ncbi:MAG: aminotransferase class I/II-fold pyridoxal phosphate-dependent enzyme [Azospirillaceae bacterium]